MKTHLKFLQWALLLSIFILNSCNKEEPIEEFPINYYAPIVYNAFTTTSKPFSYNADQIYNIENQEAVAVEIRELKEQNTYTAEQPLLLINPYGINQLSVYVYFKSEKPVKVWYTIESPYRPDFTREVNNLEYSEEMEFLALGFLPDRDCILKIYVQAVNEKNYHCYQYQGTLSWEHSNSKVPLQLQKDFQSSSKKPSKGLFIAPVMAHFDWQPFLLDFAFYDNDGYLRGHIVKNIHINSRLIIDENGDWIFEPKYNQVVVVNSKTGQVIRIYESNLGQQHHDIIIGNNNDLLRLVNANGQMEDLVESVDRTTGKASIILNMRNFFTGYDFTKNNNDWFHANSISCWREANNTSSLLISARELSAIIKVKDIYGTPAIDWIITSNKNIIDAFPQYTYLSQTSGRPNLGQHTITYIPHETDQSKYYIHFFNNFSDWNSSNNNFDYRDLEVGAIKQSSFFEKYLVDESISSLKPSQSLQVTFSNAVSSTQWQGNMFGYSDNTNIIIGSGCGDTNIPNTPRKIYEYDTDGNLILQFSFIVENVLFYRCFKYNI
ncbi:MAG: aryl-sulfate sulfotransferase [Bacteroidales bacterium]